MTVEEALRKQRKKLKRLEWLAAHPENVKRYNEARRKWKREHKALIAYKRRLNRARINKANREYRKKHPEKQKEWTRRSRLKHPRATPPPLGIWLLRFRCMDCKCWFDPDHGDRYGRKSIICNDCLEERQMHDEAPYAPREIISLCEEEGWATALLTFMTEYGRDLRYYYCSGK